MTVPLSVELASFPVDRIEFGPGTELAGRLLRIDRDELRREALFDRALGRVELALAHPGDSTRIVHVIDLVEPRVKVSGGPDVFPGILGPPRTVGLGRTHRLQGVSLVLSAVPPQPTTGVLQFLDSVVDMSGPASGFCLGSDTANLVLVIEAAPGVSNAEFDAASRRALLQAAVYLARATVDLPPPIVESFALARRHDLPRVAYVNQVQDQGLLVHTLLYGQPIPQLVPTLLHPNESFDGALVSGNWKGFMKVPTSVHSDNPVVRALYGRHGRDIEFAGTILTRGHHDDHGLKERSAQYAANLARTLGADGIVLSIEGTGNANIDYMLTVQACEEAGIAAVPLVHEFGGPDGTDTPLVDCSPRAVSMVSTGSFDKAATLPAVRQVIGGETISFVAAERLDAAAAHEVTLAALFGVCWKMASAGVRCAEF